MEKTIEIPKGYEARIEGNKIILELKKSEDERIRKELLEEIEFIIPHDDETDSEGLILPSYHARIDRYKSYLEKQKEQKPNLSDGEIEDKKRDIVAAIRNFYNTDYAKYLISFLKGLSPEDNSEDEYGQEMLGIAYKLMYEHIPENLRTQEFWDSLKFMREYTGRVAIIHSYQHPAELSEEDETYLQDALWCIEQAEKVTKDEGDMGACWSARRWLNNKLKSLRPQPQHPEIDLEKFTEKIKTFQERYKYPESISIKGAMAFMARMFYQYPNVARQWYDSLPNATMDDARKEE